MQESNDSYLYLDVPRYSISFSKERVRVHEGFVMFEC